MLTLNIQNVHTEADDVADYRIDVMVETTIIWRGVVKRHYRPEGWTRLLRRVADLAEADGQDGALSGKTPQAID